MDNKTLKEISINDIAPNPNNPRLFFDLDELSELKFSISKVGILVPLTVYENTKKYPKEKYIILDGERRWRCAKEIGLAKVPANVIDEPKDITQNILFMFNIHYFRREWELFPTALKLEILMKKLDTQSEKVLSDFTGLNKSTIRRCKILLWYPDKYRDILMNREAIISTDFFIELYPIAYRLSYDDADDYKNIEVFIDKMIEIFSNKEIIVDVKEFREIRKAMAYLEDNNKFDQFKNILNDFLTSPDKGLNLFIIHDLESDTNRKNALKYLSYFNEYLEKVNPDIISDTIFVEQMKRLFENIKKLMEKIE